jgi:hypothetical protein
MYQPTSQTKGKIDDEGLPDNDEESNDRAA